VNHGPVRIRPVERRDVPRVWSLLRELAEYERMLEWLTGTAEMLESALFGDGLRIEGLVAERAGRIVGYALFHPVFGSFRTRWRLWLEDLYVEPAARGTGAGRLLMAELARIAVARGYPAIDWEVIEWNAPALGFYERLGASRHASDWLRYRITGGALSALAASGAEPGRGAAE
jgi:hypothetical protein